MFIGRKKELAQLNSILELNTANLIVIKGRRRIGKSRLIREFAKPFKSYVFMGLAPNLEITAREQRLEFIRSFQEQFGHYEFVSNDWGDLFSVLAKKCENGRVIITLDEISWMAHGDPTFLAKLKIAWDLYFSLNKQLVLILCGSVSSWIEKNILSNTGYLGRPSLHMTIEELPLEDCNKFWLDSGANVAAFEKLKILAVTGGVPRYLELINTRMSAEDNIRNLCFNVNSALYDEFKYIFSDIYGKRSAKYQEIVTLLSKSSVTREEIINAIQLQNNGETTEYLDDLEVGGFIDKDHTWNVKTKKMSNLCTYRLKDNYTRFYLKYVLPNKSKIKKRLFENISINNLPGWHSILGLQFENLVLNNQNKIFNLLGINAADIIMANPYFQRKTNRQQACQIDLMIQTKHDVIYICEIKFSRAVISKEIISEVEEKMLRVSFPRYVSRRAVLIHVNGVSDEVMDADFFAGIIDFSDCLR